MTEAPDPQTTAPQGSGRRGMLTKGLLIVGVLAAVLLVGRQAAGALESFAVWVEGIGFWAPVVFILGYAVSVAALIPGSALTIAGGAIFGLGPGTLYVFTAAVLGSIGGFLIARYGARRWVEQRIDSDPRFASIDRAVAENGLKITFLLRLSPVFPFSFLNYALGLTRVRLRDYALASVGMLPGTILYVYSGKLTRDVASAAGGEPEGGMARIGLSAVGLLATLAVTVIVTRIARRALAEATEVESEPIASEATR